MARQKQLLTLKALAERARISYPTALRYAKDFEDRIPSEGEGRTRRYPLEAVKVFQGIRSTQKPGRKAGTGERPNSKEPIATKGRGTGRRKVGTASAAIPSSFSVGSLQLADEDRALLRELVEALKIVGGSLRTVTASLKGGFEGAGR